MSKQNRFVLSLSSLNNSLEDDYLNPRRACFQQVYVHNHARTHTHLFSLLAMTIRSSVLKMPKTFFGIFLLHDLSFI